MDNKLTLASIDIPKSQFYSDIPELPNILNFPFNLNIISDTASYFKNNIHIDLNKYITISHSEDLINLVPYHAKFIRTKMGKTYDLEIEFEADKADIIYINISDINNNLSTLTLSQLISLYSIEGLLNRQTSFIREGKITFYNNLEYLTIFIIDPDYEYGIHSPGYIRMLIRFNRNVR